MASSRVGTRTRPRGCGRAGPDDPASLMIMGRPKARVLPEPVRPRPSTSRPASASGMVAAWIGNGLANAICDQRSDQVRGDAHVGKPAGRRIRGREGSGERATPALATTGHRDGGVRAHGWRARRLTSGSWAHGQLWVGLVGMTSQFSPASGGRFFRHVERPDLISHGWEGRASLRLTSSHGAGGPDADSSREDRRLAGGDKPALILATPMLTRARRRTRASRRSRASLKISCFSIMPKWPQFSTRIASALGSSSIIRAVCSMGVITSFSPPITSGRYGAKNLEGLILVQLGECGIVVGHDLQRDLCQHLGGEVDVARRDVRAERQAARDHIAKIAARTASLCDKFGNPVQARHHRLGDPGERAAGNTSDR